MSHFIPFNRPYLTGHEAGLMADAADRGHLSGDGHYTRRASEILRSRLGVEATLLTTSCTHALEMAAILLDIQPGDEVILPSFTFVSCATALVARGATPVFVDIRSDTFNLDETLIEAAITERTKAILAVNYAGIGCEYSAIRATADQHGLALVEDNAHGLFGTWNGQPLGTFGDLGTLSFHETKNIQCGEGGALLLRDDRYLDRAEVIREKGTNRKRFFRGEVDKYTWVDVGSSYLMSDLLAAFLTAQLEEADDIVGQRRHVWNTYRAELNTWASNEGFSLPSFPIGAEHPAHLFAMLGPRAADQEGLIQHLRSRGVGAVFHYIPLHSSPGGQRFGRAGELPVTDDVSARLIRLPVYAGLTEAETERVLDAVTSYRSA